MTVKSIAQTVQKSEDTIQRWIQKLNRKLQLSNDDVNRNMRLRIEEKSAASSPQNPADYDLEETIAIIGVGLGHNAAEIFRANATQNVPQLTAGRQLPSTLNAENISLIQQIAKQTTETALLHSFDYSDEVIELRELIIDLVINEIVELQKSITGKDLEEDWNNSDFSKDSLGMWKYLDSNGYIKKFLNTLKKGGRLW
jgi:hypothetical protein